MTFQDLSCLHEIMEATTFPLNEILGWTNQDPLTSPLILVNDNTAANSDSLTTSFITHCISTGGSVCVVGAAQPASHYASICKKMGIALDRARRLGLYYHIDCLSSTINSSNTSRAEITALPGYTLEFLAERIGRAYAHWQSQNVSSLMTAAASCKTSASSVVKSDVANLPRFNIVIDNIQALADIYAQGSVSNVLDLVNFLVKMVTTPKNDITSVLTAVDAVSGEPVAVTGDQPNGSTGPRGSLLVVAAPEANDSLHAAGILQSPVQTPTPANALLAPVSTPLPSASATAAAGLPNLSAQDASFDTVLQRFSPLGAMLAHHNATQLCIDISSLPSGYSTDVHAQLTIHRFQTRMVMTQNENLDTSISNQVELKGPLRSSQIVFLSIGNDGSLKCHTRS